MLVETLHTLTIRIRLEPFISFACWQNCSAPPVLKDTVIPSRKRCSIDSQITVVTNTLMPNCPLQYPDYPVASSLPNVHD